MNKNVIIFSFVLLGLFGFMFWQNNHTPSTNPLGEKVAVYKTETCGCCGVYVSYLKRNGVEVDEINVSEEELGKIKKENGVPGELSSCHTTFVAGYVVEGHIPLQVIEKLLNDKSEIKGIAMPGMPSGTPGMPGPKTENWLIHALELGGKTSEFMTL